MKMNWSDHVDEWGTKAKKLSCVNVLKQPRKRRSESQNYTFGAWLEWLTTCNQPRKWRRAYPINETSKHSFCNYLDKRQRSPGAGWALQPCRRRRSPKPLGIHRRDSRLCCTSHTSLGSWCRRHMQSTENKAVLTHLALDDKLRMED